MEINAILGRVLNIDFIESGAYVNELEILENFLKENESVFDDFLKTHGWDNKLNGDFVFNLSEGIAEFRYLYYELLKIKTDYLVIENDKVRKTKRLVSQK